MPFGSIMRVFGGMIILSTLINTVLYLSTNYGNQWYYDWSPIFVFVGVLLIVSSLWTDARITVVVAGVIAILWYAFIILGWTM